METLIDLVRTGATRFDRRPALMIRPFFRRVLADVDRFCMQSDESARRIVELGADQSKVTVTGSLKFDSLEMPAVVSHGKPRERVLRFFRLSPNRMVLVAGSTVRGEEPAVSHPRGSYHRLRGGGDGAELVDARGAALAFACGRGGCVRPASFRGPDPGRRTAVR